MARGGKRHGPTWLEPPWGNFAVDGTGSIRGGTPAPHRSDCLGALLAAWSWTRSWHGGRAAPAGQPVGAEVPGFAVTAESVIMAHGCFFGGTPPAPASETIQTWGPLESIPVIRPAEDGFGFREQ